MPSVWRGSPRWLAGAAFFELAFGCRAFLRADLLGVLVDGIGFCACLTAAALTVHNRVIDAEHRRRLEAWEESIRDR